MILQKIIGFRKKNMRQQLDQLAMAHEHHLDSLSEKEMEMLNNIMTASRMTVEDVMVLRTNIKFLSSHMTLPDVIAEVVKSPQTRYPIYTDDHDHIIGFIHSKSILWALHHYSIDSKQQNNTKNGEQKISSKENEKNFFSLKHLARPVIFVSSAMPAFELLAKMREEKRHLAIVVDEYGSTDGLVTVTDLAEEIIGEMKSDIFIKQKLSIIATKNGYLVDPQMRTAEFEKYFGVKLRAPVDDIDIDTVGGVVLALAGYVPQKEEKIKTKDKKITFIIKDSTNRIIKSLMVKGISKKNDTTKPIADITKHLHKKNNHKKPTTKNLYKENTK
ncbi:MAG: CBS domain-containing protein [Alphaproteobacteria bacterium]